jgi:1,2-phenylacetyl-CoA epoxidase PaaB subunit
MDALNFKYPDYERLNKGAEGQKRKMIVSVLSRQAARMVKADEEALKKRKSSPVLKIVASKKRKAASPEEGTPSTTKKVMTESLPIKLLSPWCRN